MTQVFLLLPDEWFAFLGQPVLHFCYLIIWLKYSINQWNLKKENKRDGAQLSGRAFVARMRLQLPSPASLRSFKKQSKWQTWQWIPIISVLQRLRQKDSKLRVDWASYLATILVNLGCPAGPCLTKQHKCTPTHKTAGMSPGLVL